MNYKTKVGNHNIEIAPKENHLIFDDGKQTYVAWQCNSNGNRIVGWGGYENATQALKDVKAKLG